MLKGDTKPGFYIKHFLKDMRIAIESAEEMGLDLPGLCLAKNSTTSWPPRAWKTAGPRPCSSGMTDNKES